MWDVFRKVLPVGMTPMNWYCKIIAAVFVAILCTVILGNNVFAADASWDGNNIKYGDMVLKGPKKSQSNSPLKLPEGSEYYESSPSSDGRVTIIYFTDGTNVDTATGARVATYKFSPPDVYIEEGSSKIITIDQKNNSQANGNENKNEDTVESCAVNQLGYIVCPIMGLMAAITDKFYDYLKTLLEVKPIFSDRNAVLYKAWSAMVGMANIAFVIAFLAVTYSYITNYGIKQHDIRYMVPRIIVAAFLVNISYYLCAILIDVSNILGTAIQELFLNIRQEMIQSQEIANMGLPSWQQVISAGLAGATAVSVGVFKLSAGANVWGVIPVLTVVLLALFVTVAVLAARQAIIVIFIIISPFAFLAFVLPGTQKYFDKWRDVLQTMLLMFPMFSLLFGGSQLASYVIAQTADSYEVLLIAMLVSAAPLIITPFLVRFSGKMLGKFVGMINNPTKGAFDQVKNWSNERMQIKRQQRLAEGAPFSGLARMVDDHKRHNEARKARYAKLIGVDFDRRNPAVSIEQWRADDKAEAIENQNRAVYAQLRTSDRSMQVEEAGNRISKKLRRIHEGDLDASMNELQTREGQEQYATQNVALAALGRRMQEMTQEEYVNESRDAFAKDVSRSEYADSMLKSPALQKEAAGVAGDKGVAVAASRAIATKRKDFGEGTVAVAESMKHFKLTGADIDNLAKRRSTIEAKDDNGNTMVFDYNDSYVHDTAINMLMTSKGNIEQKMELVSMSSQPEFAGSRGTIAEGVKSTMLSAAPQLGGKTLDDIETSGIDSVGMENAIRDFILKGKFNQQSFTTWDPGALKRVYDVIADEGNYGNISQPNKVNYDANRQEFIRITGEALLNERLRPSIRDNTKKVQVEISKLDQKTWDKVEEAMKNNDGKL